MGRTTQGEDRIQLLSSTICRSKDKGDWEGDQKKKGRGKLPIKKERSSRHARWRSKNGHTDRQRDGIRRPSPRFGLLPTTQFSSLPPLSEKIFSPRKKRSLIPQDHNLSPLTFFKVSDEGRRGGGLSSYSSLNSHLLRRREECKSWAGGGGRGALKGGVSKGGSLSLLRPVVPSGPTHTHTSSHPNAKSVFPFEHMRSFFETERCWGGRDGRGWAGLGCSLMRGEGARGAKAGLLELGWAVKTAQVFSGYSVFSPSESSAVRPYSFFPTQVKMCLLGEGGTGEGWEEGEYLTPFARGSEKI